MGPVPALKKGFEIAGKNWWLVVILFLLNFFSGAMGGPLNAVQENTSMGMIFLGALTVIFFLFLSILQVLKIKKENLHLIDTDSLMECFIFKMK